ncbi:hypothetical protein ACFY36_15915 [Actinoplanes sp. NPDC000266]
MRTGKLSWVQDAMAEIELLTARTNIISERAGRSKGAPLNGRRQILTKWRAPRMDGHNKEETHAILNEVHGLLETARKAALGEQPKYNPVRSWWSGNCTEAAFRNIHNAEALLARVYDDNETRAEIPEAVRRARESLSIDSPVRETAHRCWNSWKGDGQVTTCDLSKVIEAGHAAADRQRLKLRHFRNIMLIGILASVLLLFALIILMSFEPGLVPLCFVQDSLPASGAPNIVCPLDSGRHANVSSLHGRHSPLDFFIVAALGLTGGALSAALFIRDLYSNATPYNVSVPLALLKLPAGALTALVGIILLAGEFVPGFSAIDKSAQILAYALVFGFAQQVFTQFLDQRGQKLINSVPTKARSDSVVVTDQSTACADQRFS